MNVRSSSALAAFVLVCGLTSRALGQAPVTGDPASVSKPWGTDTTTYLPDSTILGRIEDRIIRAREFRDSYYDSYPEFRPGPDSTGRLAFLNTMINKDVMVRVAKQAGITLPFEDRLKLREHTQRVLSNVLFQRMVTDSIVVTEAEIDHVYGQYSRDLHLREIMFDEGAVAEAARTNVLAKRTTWAQVAKANRIPKDAKSADGDIGWITRIKFDPRLGITVFDLKPGEISPVISDPQGFHLFQVVETRPARPIVSQLFRRSLGPQIREAKSQEGMVRVKRLVGRDAEMVFDSTNVRWASNQFREVRSVTQSSSVVNVEFDLGAPEITSQDTGRVLVRYRGGQISLGGFMAHFTAIPPLLRPSVHSPDLLRHQLEGLVVEPLAARAAVERGLDKDPMAVGLIEARREQFMVDAMYRDSIESKVYISAKERRAYYDKNVHRYVTWPSVQYAAFYSPTQAGADSLVARLTGGEAPGAILLADSLAGIKRGSIQTRRKDDSGPYHKILFEELRPGRAIVVPPDKEGNRAVLYQIHYDPERQLPFDEADRYVDEALTNLATEKLLNAFLERHRKEFAIELYSERLMRIRFTPPELD